MIFGLRVYAWGFLLYIVYFSLSQIVLFCKMKGVLIMIPRKPVSIDTALRIYYENPELGNAEIKELFGEMSSAAIAKIKRQVRVVQSERGVMRFRGNSVNTEIAYEVWGINAADLERRRAKLMKLNLVKGAEHELHG